MILHPIIDLLKRIVVALPDYAGGGDITDLLPSKDILSITEYIHAEDWTTDALGNSLNFAQTYMDYGNTSDVVIAYVYNNTVNGGYQASCLMTWAAGASRTFTNNNAAGGIGSGSSFYIAAGSLVRVIHLTSNNKSQTEEIS